MSVPQRLAHHRERLPFRTMGARRSVQLTVVAALATVALAGCGTNERDQVKAKVDQFVKATAGHDYATLCKDVLAPKLLAHLTAYGIKCEQAMAIGLRSVSQPNLAIGSITITGNTASVTTITTAKGQEASLTAIVLTNTGGGWRVSSLGTPQFPRRVTASG
jgi:hypothetical protein